MTWFIVIIGEIIPILVGVVIVLLSAELPPPPIHPVVKPQQPLDNPTDSSDNGSIEKQIGELND